MYIPRKMSKEKKIIIFSGAGLDAPSGIQTFRGDDGMWNESKISEICDERTWKKNWKQVHEFYNGLRKSLPTFEPNDAHFTIKRIIEKYGQDNVFNITMNISDMFERIDTEVLHLHGELTQMECTSGKCSNWEIKYDAFDTEQDVCPTCGNSKTVRPKIVFFGGSASMYSYLHRALEYLDHKDSILLVIGTTGSVVDVDMMTKGRECTKILIDIHAPTDINVKKFDYVLLSGALDGMIEAEKIISEKLD